MNVCWIVDAGYSILDAGWSMQSSGAAVCDEGTKGVRVQEHKNRGRRGILGPQGGDGGGDFLSKISVNSFGSV
jgi:hypothetical protein